MMSNGSRRTIRFLLLQLQFVVDEPKIVTTYLPGMYIYVCVVSVSVLCVFVCVNAAVMMMPVCMCACMLV
jgi:hypothetical protein